MTEQMMDGTAAGLLAFLAWAADRGALNASTAGAMRAAVTQVVEIEADDPATVDVRRLDVEDLLDRFARKRGHKYSPDSLNTYFGRFRRACDMYVEYLDNPAGWRPPKGRPARKAKPERSGTNGDSAPPPSTGSLLSPATLATPHSAESQLITYPFPLRSGTTAYFQLPRELPRAEVERMIGFLQSLAIDPQPALPPGSSA